MDRDRDDAVAANALEGFLTDRLNGQAVGLPLQVPLAEASLAAELVTLAQATCPDQAFVAGLERRLGRRRVWARLAGLVPGLRALKGIGRLVLAATVLVGLAWLILAGLPTLFPRGGLPRLPALGAMRTWYNRAPWRSDLLASEVEWTLAADLPAGPGRARVFWQPEVAPRTAQEAQAWGKRFGLDGPVYVAEATRWLPPSYRIFADQGQLELRGGQVSYWLNDEPLPTAGDLLPFDQAADVAKNFLQARGLLNFSFQVLPCPEGGIVMHGGRAVCFVRLVDGWPVRYGGELAGNVSAQAEVIVWVGADYQVKSVTCRPLTLKQSGVYLIRSARDAWELVRAGRSGRLALVTMLADVPHGQSDMRLRLWSPQYRPGERVDLYSMLTTYWPADGDGQPVFVIGGLRINDPQGDFRRWAQAHSKDMVHLWGNVRRDALGVQRLDVKGWSKFASHQPSEFEGSLERKDQQVLLTYKTGERYVLSAPPDDVSDGIKVRGVGYVTDRVKGNYRVLDWLYMYSPPEASLFSWGDLPPGGKAWVDHVELVYYALPAAELVTVAGDKSALHMVQPMWRFSGHLEGGAMFEVLVQAVRDDYIAVK